MKIRSSVRFHVSIILSAIFCAIVQAQTSDSAQHYLKQGLARYKSGDLDGAIVDFSRAIELNSRAGEINKKNGHLRNLVEDKTEPPVQTRVVVVDRFNALAYYNRGIAWAARGDTARAIEDFDKAIKIDPRYVEAYIRR